MAQIVVKYVSWNQKEKKRLKIKTWELKKSCFFFPLNVSISDTDPVISAIVVCECLSTVVLQFSEFSLGLHILYINLFY